MTKMYDFLFMKSFSLFVQNLRKTKKKTFLDNIIFVCELNGNGKHIKYNCSKLILNNKLFSYVKYIRLVLLYLWVTDEVIDTNVSAKN